MDNRNPFRIRTSEKIDSDEAFLHLFGPDALDLLENKSGLFDKIQVFCSAPGAGKTSLLRIFTPSVLNALFDGRNDSEFGLLFQRLKGLGVISDTGASCLGLKLSLARNYARLEDLTGNKLRSERLLFSLLNARLILFALRGALTLNRLSYPVDLDKIQFIAPSHNEIPASIPLPASGIELLKWATDVERSICRAIDNVGSQTSLDGHETLHAMQMLNPNCILCEGKPVAARTLVMLDDFHELTQGQRDSLRQTLAKLRPPVGIWLSQRLEALSPESMFPGATSGREYEETLYFEDFWNSSNRFQSAVFNIADKRVKTAKDSRIGNFAGKLLSSLSLFESEKLYSKALKAISDRVKSISGHTPKYNEWIKAKESVTGSSYEKALAWRMLEIMIERDRKKSQLTFDLDVPLAAEVLDDKENSALRAAAEFLMAEEFDLPYYFGSSRLAALSSFNIDQFLALSGDLFEEMISEELLSPQTVLAPQRQEKILKDAVKVKWDEILRKIPSGREVQNFLKAIYDCAEWEKAKGTASYGAGGAVTGIAFTMQERDLLINPENWERKPEYKRLVLILSSCIANNLLDASVNRSQGTKDKRWIILYLNRWLCLHFQLPLQLGGWRPKSLSELSSWLDYGFRPPESSKKNDKGA